MSKLVRSRPRTHFAQCHRDGVAHINPKAVNFLSAAAIFWIEKLQFHIRAITIKPAEGAFFDCDAVEFHACRHRFGEGRSSLESVSSGKIQRPGLRSGSQVPQIVVSAVLAQLHRPC
jgi:hypothetical protein